MTNIAEELKKEKPYTANQIYDEFNTMARAVVSGNSSPYTPFPQSAHLAAGIKQYDANAVRLDFKAKQNNCGNTSFLFGQDLDRLHLWLKDEQKGMLLFANVKTKDGVRQEAHYCYLWDQISAESVAKMFARAKHDEALSKLAKTILERTADYDEGIYQNPVHEIYREHCAENYTKDTAGFNRGKKAVQELSKNGSEPEKKVFAVMRKRYKNMLLQDKTEDDSGDAADLKSAMAMLLKTKEALLNTLTKAYVFSIGSVTKDFSFEPPDARITLPKIAALEAPLTQKKEVHI